MTPNEIVKVLNEHERWLTKRPGGRRANLALQDLLGVALPGANLQLAKLAGVNFRRRTSKVPIWGVATCSPPT